MKCAYVSYSAGFSAFAGRVTRTAIVLTVVSARKSSIVAKNPLLVEMVENACPRVLAPINVFAPNGGPDR